MAEGNKVGGGPDGRPPAIALKKINKTFGTVRANRDIDLEVAPGTIHGIVGENGAGKSTLMNILYGLYRADSGEMAINGKVVAMHSSADAIANGIGMVHQHFMLVPNFTVLENVMLGSEGGTLLKAGRNETRSILRRFGDVYDMFVDADAVIGELPVGLQQRVEIIKALKGGARILILDEPTGVLTPQEADSLFDILRTLRGKLSLDAAGLGVRKVLVVTQFCIGIVLILSTLIIYDQLRFVRAKDLGFQKDQTAVISARMYGHAAEPIPFESMRQAFRPMRACLRLP